MKNKDIIAIARSNIKQPSLERYPTKLVFATPSQSEGVYQIKERGKEIHHLIMSRSVKVNIPLMRVTRKHQMDWHGGKLTKFEKATLRA
jgi:hypothetical protein